MSIINFSSIKFWALFIQIKLHVEKNVERFANFKLSLIFSQEIYSKS